jgi:hypothetical protein
MREFPRDRYMRDYVGRGSKGGDWPVCSVAFAFTDELEADIAALLPSDQNPPTEAIATRYYDGSIAFEYEPALAEAPLSAEPVLAGLKAFASGARRLAAPAPEQEEATAATRNALAQWALQWQDQLKGLADLRNDAGAKALAKLKAEAESKSNPQTADLVEALHEAIDPVLDAAKAGPFLPKLDELIEDALPVLIYFENYGVLDSAIYLPRFLEDLQREPNNPRARTINAMFKHVALDAKDIAELGTEEARAQRLSRQQPTAETVARGSTAQGRAPRSASTLPRTSISTDFPIGGRSGATRFATTLTATISASGLLMIAGPMSKSNWKP